MTDVWHALANALFIASIALCITVLVLSIKGKI
jgi:hypothetical protein